MHPIARNWGKEPVIPDDVDTLADDELSSSSSPSLSLSPTKNARESTKAKSCKKSVHHPTFKDAISGTSRRTRRETDMRQNQSVQAPGNTSILPIGTMPPILFAHPAFDTGLTFYMPPTTLIRRPDDMLSLPLGQHILDYEPLHEFVILAFATFDGSINPYDHMLHYNLAMILNTGNDRLLCKVFSASM